MRPVLHFATRPRVNLDAHRIACYGSSAGAAQRGRLHDDLADLTVRSPARLSTRVVAIGTLGGRDW